MAIYQGQRRRDGGWLPAHASNSARAMRALKN